MTGAAPPRPVGQLLRGWRERRRLSQLELALRVDVSTRHLSSVETGRARPSSDMILRLTDQLEVPLRERNEMLLAGGFAPQFPGRSLDAPALAQVADALRLVLDRHLPYPAVVLNRWWEMVDANAAIAPLLDGVAPHLLEPPVNVLRLTLHPDGLASRVVNLGQWRNHLLAQLRRRAETTGDARLGALHRELIALPGGGGPRPGPHDVVLPMQLRVGDEILSMFTFTASVGTAADVTVDEVVVETFYPADDATRRHLARLAGEGNSSQPPAAPSNDDGGG